MHEAFVNVYYEKYTNWGCRKWLIVLIYPLVTDICASSADSDTHMYSVHGQLVLSFLVEVYMDRDKSEYYIVRERALPEVLLGVVEAKMLLESEKALSVAEATDRVGVSRSSFYKYKDDIFRFHDDTRGTTITLTFNMDDEPGLLSDVLKIVAEHGANILTIHQSVPVGGVASLTISIQVLETTKDVSSMIRTMENTKGVHHVRVTAKQ